MFEQLRGKHDVSQAMETGSSEARLITNTPSQLPGVHRGDRAVLAHRIALRRIGSLTALSPRCQHPQIDQEGL